MSCRRYNTGTRLSTTPTIDAGRLNLRVKAYSCRFLRRFPCIQLELSYPSPALILLHLHTSCPTSGNAHLFFAPLHLGYGTFFSTFAHPHAHLLFVLFARPPTRLAQIFSGVVTLGGVVVLVVLVAAGGDSSGSGRRLFSPQLLSSSGGSGAPPSRWLAGGGRPAVGAGAGGYEKKALRYSHSRRRLSASRAGRAGGGSAAGLREARPINFGSSTQAASGCGDATACGDVSGAAVGGSGAEPPGGGGGGAGGVDSRGRGPPGARDGRLRGRKKTSEPERRKEGDARATSSGSTEEGAAT